LNGQKDEMKDRFFYPLACLIIAGIIAFALSFKDAVPELTRADILKNGFVVEGQALGFLTASEGTMTELRSDEGGMAVLKSQIVKDIAPPSAGVFATLGPEYESAFANTLLEIKVTARRGDADRKTRLEIGYFTAGSGDSGWKAFELTDKFEIYSLYFRPGAKPEIPSQDYVGLWPDPTGQDKSVEITSISVKPAADDVIP